MKNMSGFNLFELLIVMSIVAIMAMIGIPSFKYVTAANRVSSEVNSLLGDMQYARSEAVKEGLPVTVCASANPTATAPSCSGSNAWQTGWIVFSDPTNSQT
jgi:type IV fimbrial biogenesis protein FimT